VHIGKLVFSQVIDSLPMHAFRRGVARYDGNRYKKTFSCLDQYLCMTFTQLTHRESLRDIEGCLCAQKDKLYHRGRHFSRNPKWGPSDFGCKQWGDGHCLRRPAFVPSRTPTKRSILRLRRGQRTSARCLRSLASLCSSEEAKVI